MSITSPTALVESSRPASSTLIYWWDQATREAFLEQLGK